MEEEWNDFPIRLPGEEGGPILWEFAGKVYYGCVDHPFLDKPMEEHLWKDDQK